ncbi:MAG TPA: 5-(carboxyamino)imidazole ribonucleotide synthase [Candidatus Saccharimonadales bacterium]|nr:5-(carboxyamino)imidazole ribonucleotide synthase [Candidatus Saccharimonadales bacterium]
MVETIGIVGGGQLGRMLTLPAHTLGFRVAVVDPAENCPAAQVGAEHIRAGLNDKLAIGQLATSSDVITWEIEHIPADYLTELAETGHNIQPSPFTLAVIQDKLTQKQWLQSRGIPVAPFSQHLDETAFLGGGPYIVKSRKGGYDGRGNVVVHTFDDPRIAEQFGKQPVYAEQAVAFEKELAIIAARDMRGNIKLYPPVETIHQDNICHMVLSPAEVPPETILEAAFIARESLEGLDGSGVFAIEMFLVNGRVLVNEIAPRVHNSGHLTIEANATSQFEQHIRAITGLPLGDTTMRAPAAVMINILGTRDGHLDRTGLANIQALPDTHAHFYGKNPRPARKIGHITVLGDSIASAKQTALRARANLSV